jgi:hypothetical protein
MIPADGSLQYWNLNSLIINFTLILPLVLHGYEMHSLTLKEENRLKVSEDRVLSSKRN